MSSCQNENEIKKIPFRQIRRNSHSSFPKNKRNGFVVAFKLKWNSMNMTLCILMRTFFRNTVK